jgi:N-acetylglutamate synthase-like GNAT family acetyltransferase
VSEVHVEVLADWDPATVADLARLLPQVSSSAPVLTSERVGEVVRAPSTHIVVVRLDGAIVAMALLLVCTTFAGDFGMVEEVAVDDEVRGRHESVHLMIGLLRHAAGLGLRFVDLTSRPSRVQANSLYKKLGFNLRETNCYRHDLDPIPEPW